MRGTLDPFGAIRRRVVSRNMSYYEELLPEECMTLLARCSVGRLAGIVEGKPFLFPVNYTLDGNAVVFRTDPGTKLAGAGFGPVAFEVDGVDETEHIGWSVIVQGMGTEITDALDHDSEALRGLNLKPWAQGDKAHWVAIHAESITGRRLRPD